MWFPTYQKGIWAKYPNGDAEYLTPLMEQAQKDANLWQPITEKINAAQEVVQARVKRMWTTTFLDNIVLADGPTPFSHDQYPFVPFVGYLDRYGQPFGVPHQMNGLQQDINERRSMAKAIMKNRRVVVEEDAVSGDDQKDKAAKLQNIHDEAQKIDGFMVVGAGKKDKIEIIEGTDRGQWQAQMTLLDNDERQLEEITGANREQAGYKSQAISGIAQQERKQQSSVMLAPLFENYRRSRKILGYLQVAEIQGQWRGEKILRITDRMRGADKFVILNERKRDPVTGQITISNNITQGKFDIIISEAPADDTVREQNMNLLIEWAKKSPPQMIPTIYFIAMELSNLPNKDLLMSKLRPLAGIDPEEENLSPEQAKQKTLMVLKQHQEEAQKQAAWREQMQIKALDKVNLENELLKAQIAEVRANPPLKAADIKVKSDKVNLEGFKIGFDAKMDAHEAAADRDNERWQRDRQREDEKKGAAA
jgi:hypothetical protein